VKNCSFVIIFWLTPALNSCTCFLMYLKKASLDQRPRSIIVKTGTPPRYIAMAAPLRAECRPTVSGSKPRASWPIDVAAALIRDRSSLPENKWIELSGKQKVFTVDSGDEEG